MTPDARFTALLDDLKMLGVTQSNMFGKRGMMSDGKVFARILDDAMSFRLADGTKEHAEALSLDGAELWDGHGDGHPFKGWVSVPMAHEDEWGRFAEIALRQIRQKLYLRGIALPQFGREQDARSHRQSEGCGYDD